MLSAAIEAFERIFTPPFRSVFWKSLALTLALLALAWAGLERVVVHYADGAPAPLPTLISIATGLGLVFLLAYFIAPVSALVAGFFLDELAGRVEADPGPVGRNLPAGLAVRVSVKFALMSLAVNAIALLVFLIPGVNIAVFYIANAYLFGREYFELSALRFRDEAEVDGLLRRHALYLFVAGLPIALILSIPVINLLTPLFATAYMTLLHRRMSAVFPAVQADS